ncbi:MAG: hypothetical protein K1X28_03410 [Parachlamydiales bacterium]|nr:hypothetical protein [Parachlamydiales bacterium]
MSTTAKKLVESAIHEEIRSHKAWYGNLSGLVAEKMLRGRKTPYLFLLRKGEKETGNKADYYVSFILPDLSIRHQPFTIELTPEGWEWENTGGGGCPPEASIEDVLYLMMHCEKHQPTPINKLEVK